MSPILVRPVREQLEHDRIIRQLQAKFRRKFDALINPGNEQTAPVGVPPQAIYPDVVLNSLERGRKLLGIVEVETGESVNHLEAMAQWAHLGRARAPFHLYVPAGCVDIARRLASENGVNVAEIWSFHTIGDQTRFTLVHRAPASEARRSVEAAKPAAARPAVQRPAAKPAVRKRVQAAPVRRTAAKTGQSARSTRSRTAAAKSSARPAKRK